MKKYIFVILVLLPAVPQGHTRLKDFDRLRVTFIEQFQKFKLPELRLSYTENLGLIAKEDILQQELVFFNDMQQRLTALDITALDKQQMTDFKLMRYETGMNLERLPLELKWKTGGHSTFPESGLNGLTDGKAWYRYFLKKWLGAQVSPEEIYQFGLIEVSRVQRQIESIRQTLKMNEDKFYKHLDDSSFFMNDEREILDSFKLVKEIVLKNMDRLFLPHKVPPLSIRRSENKEMAQAPGYYSGGVFYFNLFDRPFCERQLDWLFIHEAVPGHHYQHAASADGHPSDLQQLFHYGGYAEGWAAYVEEYGKELGLYRTVYDELGKWEWDIVRSVRVPLDIGINYLGWTDTEAMAFWKKNIRNQDGIAMREIARVRRWPGQVIAYKYGASKFLEWRKRSEQLEGTKFDVRRYHDKILLPGGLPFFMIEENIFNAN